MAINQIAAFQVPGPQIAYCPITVLEIAAHQMPTCQIATHLSDDASQIEAGKGSPTAITPSVEPRLTSNGNLMWIGKKFAANGSVLPYPGNTILCHLSSEDPFYNSLSAIHENLKEDELAGTYTLLPASSWHMTIFQGVSDQIRKPSHWPRDVAQDSPLASCNTLFEKKLRSFKLDILPPFRMIVAALELAPRGIRLRLKPIHDAEENRLRALRDKLSELLQIRQKGHETYVFHLTLAYRILPLDQQLEEAFSERLRNYHTNTSYVLEFGAPEFCHFDNMFSFDRQFFLSP